MGLVKEELKKIDLRSRGDTGYSDGIQLTIQPRHGEEGFKKRGL